MWTTISLEKHSKMTRVAMSRYIREKLIEEGWLGDTTPQQFTSYILVAHQLENTA